MILKMKTKILEQYDCIGFDLDNTIAEYKELELVNLVYELLAKYLIDKNYFDAADVLEPISSDIDFLRKGLTLDTMRGNILSLAEDGSILRACHGTQPLSISQIEQIYGPDKKWDVAVKHCDNFLSTWNGELSEKIRSCLDYFDISVPLLFARVIDSVDRKNQSVSAEYDVWPKIMEALFSVYKTGSILEEGEYYRIVRGNLSKYLHKCSQSFLTLLDSLKSMGIKTFLLTGSKKDYANAIASYVMSEKWTEYFDVVVYFAKKPGFFVQNRPFLTVDVERAVEDSQLVTNCCYSQGNWPALYQLFCRITEKCELKCLYIGDNLIQDVYTPARHKCCDTIAIVKELSAENDENNRLFHSKVWGSFLYDHNNSLYTVWGKVIQHYPRSCVPSVEWFVDPLCREHIQV